MKKITLQHFFYKIIFLNILVISAFSQTTSVFNENAVKEKLINEGVSSNEIPGLLKYLQMEFEQKKLGITDQNIPFIPLSTNDCYNNDFESGSTTGWNGCRGSTSNPCSKPGMVGGRHTLMSGGGVDPCGGFPMVAPGGTYSFRLGNNANGSEAEEVYKTFTVSATNTNFTYQFAVVLEDPNHTPSEQPYFQAVMFDQNGDTIPCSYYHVTSGQGIPGFQNSWCNDVIYRPWTSVYIDLTNYIGQSVTIRFSTADCSQGGHYGYAYIDASCSQFEITSQQGCGTGVGILSAPLGAASYVWSPGGETTQTKTVTTAGMYCVTMTSVQGCKTQLCYNYVPGPLSIPTAEFTYSTATCDNAVSVTDGSATNVDTIKFWKWDFGDGTTSNTQYPATHIYNQPGTYDIQLIVKTGIGCMDTAIHQVQINSDPVATYTLSNACIGTQVSFADMSSGANITNWMWRFGDGTTSTSVHETHTYNTIGTYATWLIIEDINGCKDSLKKNITINPLPKPDFFSTPVCLNNKTIFKDLSIIAVGSINACLWDFGDGATSSQTNPNHTYTSSGTLYVKLIAISSNGCLKDTIKPIVVNPLPSANYTSTAICLRDTCHFTDASTISFPDNITTWKWFYGDGSPIGTLQNPTHVYLTPGSFNASLIVTSNNGCMDTIVKQVDVYTLPNVAFSQSAVVGCMPFCITLFDSSKVGSGTINSWQWDFGNGTSSVATNPTVCYENAGSYSVKLKVTSNHGCSSKITKPNLITVYPLPTAEFDFGPQPVTVIEPLIQYQNLSSADASESYWYFGDGDSLINPEQYNPSHNFISDQPQTYNTKLVVMNQFGCKDTVMHEVIISPNWSLYIPNAFTPNDDGKNDMFYAKGINIEQFDMMILNRWGDVIYTTTDINSGWNGRTNGGSEMAQQDVYVYVMNFKDVFNNKHKLSGHVTLVK